MNRRYSLSGIKHILLLPVALIIFITCRKIDHQPEKASIEIKESDFFTKHQSGDPYIQSIMDFIKRKNEKEHFVDNWIQKIGYPYWDKSIKKQKRGIASGRISNDTINTLFIPFVIDSQNIVNTTLVVNTSSSDTNFHFISNWQYKNRPYGSISADTTAENVALLFMILDRGIFGYNEFQIIDSNLFASSNILPGLNGRTIRFNTNANGQLKVSTAVTYTLCMMTSYFCGTPYSSHCINGCDYLNCYNGTSCYPLYTCTDYVIEDDPAPPPPPGSSPGGGTGGGGTGGGGTTPPECPPGPVAKVSTLPGCTPGWTPPGVTAFFSVTEINKDSITNPCLLAVIDSIGQAGHTNFLFKLYQTYFGSANDNYKIKYIEDSTLVDTAGNPVAARTFLDSLSSGIKNVTIRINHVYLQNASKEFVATVIFHELVHPFITFRYGNLYPTLKSQHQFIFNSWVPSIGRAVKELYPGRQDSDYMSLALQGLDEVYIDPVTNQIIPSQNTYAVNNYNINIATARTLALQFLNGISGIPC